MVFFDLIESLPPVLRALIPMVLFLSLGFALGVSGLINKHKEQRLKTLVFRYLMPLFIFLILLRAKFPHDIDFTYYLAHFGGVFGVSLITIIVATRFLGYRPPETFVFSFAASQPNIGFIGVAIVTLSLGHAAAVPVALIVGVNLPVNLTLSSLMVNTIKKHEEKESLGRVLFNSFLRALSDPIVMAALSGLLLNQFANGWANTMPSVMSSISFLIIFFALVVVGIGIGHIGFGIDQDIFIVGFCKLIIHPLIAYSLCTFVFQISPLWTQVATIFAAAPTGLNALPFAFRYGRPETFEKVSRLFTMTTLMSMVSYWLWFWVIGL